MKFSQSASRTQRKESIQSILSVTFVGSVRNIFFAFTQPHFFNWSAFHYLSMVNLYKFHLALKIMVKIRLFFAICNPKIY